MGTAHGRTMNQIGYETNPKMKRGKYIKDCPRCGLMLAIFDIVKGRKKPVCPRCYVGYEVDVNDRMKEAVTL